MSHPERPRFLTQDPNNGGSCVHNGRQFGWLNCTPTSTAMLVRQATLGDETPSGCDIRILTGDWDDGTMLSQCGRVAEDEYGVPVSVRVGSNFAEPSDVKGWLRAGRGVVIQGNAIAMVNTGKQSTNGAVNHAVYAQELVERQGQQDHVWVYDPARSDRRAAFGKVEEGPQLWSWDLLMEFASELRPWGDRDPRKLGRGRLYAMVGPDVEPHVHLRFQGSHATSELPREFVVRSPVPGERVNVRKGPSRQYGIVKTKLNGSTFAAWQRTDRGQEMAGSRTWFGNHSGTRWVHASGLEAK